MISKKELEILLSGLNKIEKPRPSLEQYTIPSRLAAEILNLAYLSGDLKGKLVADLGCGSGILAIGASLFDAKQVVAVDIDDDALKTAKENVELVKALINKKIKIKFVNSDVSEWGGRVDTVIQNPPFGIQKEHADRIFLDKALKSARKIYSLHRSYYKSRDFIEKFVNERNGKVKNIITYKFRIPHMFSFHKKSKVEFDVDLFVIEVLSWK